MRIMHFAKKRAMHLLVPAGRCLYRVLDVLLLKHVRSLADAITSEARRFAQGFPLAVHRIKQEYTRHPLHALCYTLMLPFIAIRRHHKALRTIFNLAAPAAAVLVLVTTVNYWSHMTFALSVEYNGKTLGYVADESVYDAAATMATDRVINADNTFAVQRVPKMTIAVVSQSDILSESAVCDKILESSSNSIAEASGLYIDGKFEGAVESRTEVDSMLQSILKTYLDGSKNERAEFVQDVKVTDGLYPVSSIVSVDDLKKELTASTVVEKYYTIVKGDSPLLIASKTGMSMSQLQALNPKMSELIYAGKKLLIQGAQPYLRVQVVRTVTYTQSIAYSTKKVNDSRQYIGYTAVRTSGVNGTRSITAEVTYLDGLETSRNILSTTVTKNPVDKVVVVGAKKVNPNSYIGDGISTGTFIWPLPSCKMISSGYGYRWGGFHRGIDISGNGVYGKSIIAADGGTVSEVNTSGWGAGYGKYVIINHGNGYCTLYAHCSSVLVRAGQKVSQGQLIAKAGESGDADGAHLHFEIRIHGSSVNPLSYLRR